MVLYPTLLRKDHQTAKKMALAPNPSAVLTNSPFSPPSPFDSINAHAVFILGGNWYEFSSQRARSRFKSQRNATIIISKHLARMRFRRTL
eukprot:UN3431